MNPIKYLTEDELQDILNGCVDGVYPTTQVVAMANELIAVRARIKELESDAHINEIKAQGIDEFIKNCPPYERNMGALDDGTMVTWHCYNIHHLTNYIEKLRAKHD